MKKFGEGQQPFHAIIDIPEGDSQELTTVTDQALNSLYGELFNLLQAHGINPTTTTNADLKQVARAVWAAVVAGTLFIDSGTANLKNLIHVKGSSFLYKNGSGNDDGFTIEFVNKITNTGAVLVSVFDAENNSNHFNLVPLVNNDGSELSANTMTEGAMVKARYDTTVNKFIVISIGNMAAFSSHKDGQGDAMLAVKQPFVGSVARFQHDKNSEIVSVSDFGGAVDGTTDDTTAITNARNAASGKKPLLFDGAAKASGYWENLSPLITEYLGGTPTNYMTNVVSTKPLTSHKFFNATPQTGAGFAGYSHRTDVYTKADIDVASTVGFASVVNALSTNNGGANTTNNTNQVAILASASAQSATASAPVTAINAIAASKYSGQTWQPVVGIEIDVSVTNPPGTFGQNGKSTGIGVSAILSESSVEDGAIAYAADTSKAGKGWRHGVQISGVVNTGVTIARNTVTPQTGVWVSAATTYGVYVGAKQLHDLGAGKNPSYDAEHNPQIGIALGQTGATSSRSNYLRFTATNSSGAEQNIDLYHTGYTLAMRFNGNDAVLFTPNNIYIGGNSVVGIRKTGFTEMNGTKDKATALDTATVTIQQLAQRVSAIQEALTAHGLIGN